MSSSETGFLSERLYPSYLEHHNTIGFVEEDGLSRSCGCYLSPRCLAANAQIHTYVRTHTHERAYIVLITNSADLLCTRFMTARKCGGEEVAYSPREIASGPTDYISKFKASSHSDGIKDRELGEKK